MEAVLERDGVMRRGPQVRKASPCVDRGEESDDAAAQRQAMQCLVGLWRCVDRPLKIWKSRPGRHGLEVWHSEPRLSGSRNSA